MATRKVPVAEDDPKQPINPYGASKLMTERMLADVSAAHPFNYGALRYFNVAGADPQGRTGQIGKGSTHLIKVAVEAAVGKRDHVAVYGTDYPTPRRHLHPRLYPCQRSCRRACRSARWLIGHPDENLVMNCGYGRASRCSRCSTRSTAPTELRLSGDGRAARGRSAGAGRGQPRVLDTLDWQPRYADIDAIVGDALAWERKLLLALRLSESESGRRR